MEEENKIFLDDRVLEKRDLDGKYKKSWVEESFVFEKSFGKQTASSGTKNYLGTSVKESKIFFLAIIIVLGVFLIFFKVSYLQLWRGNYYFGLAENNRVRLKPISAARGIIYDRFGNELTQNVPNFILAIVPQDLPVDEEKRKKVIAKISEVSGITEENLDNLLEKYKFYNYESLLIKDNLDYNTAITLYVQNADLSGIYIGKSTKRQYLIGDNAIGGLSFSHLLGYLGKLNESELEELKNSGYLISDNIGKIGLEKFYEKELRGTYGMRKIEVDALGHEQSVLAEDPPTPGKNLYLSIDLEAQNKLEELIKNSFAKNGKKKSAAIAMDPRDGSVLAMVSWPTFDSNLFAGGITQKDYDAYLKDENNPLFNRAISGTYPSGSIVKPVIAAAALEEKIITQRQTIMSVGGLQIGDWFFPDWKAGGHGATNVTKALAWSVNTFFFYVGGGYKNFDGLGLARLLKYLRDFNLAQKTDIDLPGESEGFLPSEEWKEETKNEQWYIGDTYNLSIGQGDLSVTPIQAAVWTSAVANGGKIFNPRLGNKFIDPITQTEEKIKPKIIRENFVSQENLAVVRQGMRECVTYGSCQLLQTLPFMAAGKTGTAQWNSKKSTHAWFTSFAPYNDPQIVITVLVEEGGEGSVASMPIARDFLAWWGKKYLPR